MRTLLLSALLVLLSGCATNMVDDPSFDRWCGDELCAWQTDDGRIERVGTWHEKDFAVSFVEQGTQISQLSKSSVPGSCIRFDLIADVDARAELSLRIDFDDDSLIDFEQTVPAVRWETSSFVVHTPSSYSKVRYIFHKAGTGRAVLAQLWADLESGCAERQAAP